MKKLGIRVVFLCTVLLCIIVFPVSLVRKEETVDPVLNTEYGRTENGHAMTQIFQAQSSYLEGIAFDIGFSDGKPLEGSLIFTLKREDKEEVIFEKAIELTEINDGLFTYVPVKRWISKGQVYSYSIASSDDIAEFQAIHTLSDDEAALGSKTLYFQGESVNGQAVTRYIYTFPLNYKNVICLWAFILTIGLTLTELIDHKASFAESKFISKLEKLLIQWQIPILLLEVFVIMIMIIRLCRNDVINWDEAFTWQIVTKNNVPGMIKATAADVHPPLYYLIVMAAIAIFGKNIFVVKMVTAAGAFATQMLGITLVRKRWGVKAAIPFLLLAGLGPQMIYYNIDVRMYSWLCFFVVAAGLFAYEIILTKKMGWWIAFTFMSLAGVYTQYFAAVPLAFFYLSLLVWTLIWERAQLKTWIVCSIVTVAGYLPWLGVVMNTIKRDGLAESGSKNMTLSSLCEWAFGNNIKFSEYMPAVMFVVAVLCFAINFRKYTRKERGFLICASSTLFISYVICILITSRMNHFWNNRYLIAAFLILWLFMLTILSNKNLLIWGCSMVWLGIIVLSSYTVMQAKEFEAIPWMQEAKRLLEPVQKEEKIVYNADSSFDILYEYYLPNAEFVWYENVNFDEMGKEFYMISWGGNEFAYSLYESGYLTKEVQGKFCIWEGLDAELWKIRVND